MDTSPGPSLRRAHRARTLLPALLALLVLLVAGCSGASKASTRASATAAASKTATAAPSNTVWLCRPGLANNPCDWPENATLLTATGATALEQSAPAQNPAFDCFYVYPTVSSESGANADLQIQPVETDAAIEQASRFSSVCNVWAPMYRQRTLGSLLSSLNGTIANNVAADLIAYNSLLSAFEDYLAHDNHGRPIVLIGHSQGAAMLIRLLQNKFDNDPSLRGRLISAIILGGNVQVPTGKGVGGSFQHIPACRSDSQTGCVIAYSTFLSQPPTNSLFGRPGQGVSIQSGQTARAGQQVLCTNPAALSGGSAALTPYVTIIGKKVAGTTISTSWVTFPGMYTATCTQDDGASWLQITESSSASDPRPHAAETNGPAWGLHTYDLNIALGNLIDDVRHEEAAYTAAHTH